MQVILLLTKNLLVCDKRACDFVGTLNLVTIHLCKDVSEYVSIGTSSRSWRSAKWNDKCFGTIQKAASQAATFAFIESVSKISNKLV